MNDLEITLIVLVIIALACRLIIFGYQMSNRNEESAPTWYTRMIAPIMFILFISIICIIIVAIMSLVRTC